jgi:hypothetical protein
MSTLPAVPTVVNPAVQVNVVPSIRPTSAAQLATFSAVIRFPDGHGVRIHDGRILKSKAGATWACLPTHSIPGPNKTWQYQPTVELSSALSQEVSAAALAAYDAWKPQQQQPVAVEPF